MINLDNLSREIEEIRIKRAITDYSSQDELRLMLQENRIRCQAAEALENIRIKQSLCRTPEELEKLKTEEAMLVNWLNTPIGRF